MKLTDLLEAPLADISFHSSKLPGSFTSAEVALIKKYMKENIYSKKLERLPFKLYVYLIDDRLLGEKGAAYPEGELTREHLSKMMYASSNSGTKISLEHEILKHVLEKVLENMKGDSGTVHFIMGDNATGDGTTRISITPWMLVHRLIHAMASGKSVIRKSMRLASDLEISSRYDWKGTEQIQKEARKIFTFKSAADADEEELLIELLTQALVGPKGLVLDVSSINNDVKREKMEALADEINKTIRSEIKQATGRIYYI